MSNKDKATDSFNVFNELNIPMHNKLKISHSYSFENRSQDANKLCIILAGYKPILYSAVLTRISTFIPTDIDVCVVSSGIKSEELIKICKEKGWSYLCTKRNNVCMAQNTAITLHPSAELIYKIDEDMFITEHFFENMLEAYEKAKRGFYRTEIVAPLIPLNGFSYIRVLEKLDLISVYAKLFGPPSYGTGGHHPVENNPDVAKFFWGEGGFVPSIDTLSEMFGAPPLVEIPCPIRFSIGAILFSRKFWVSLGSFYPGFRNGMGLDEAQIASFCSLNSCPILVSENAVAGHLSFGNQNKEMNKYFIEHPDVFEYRKQ